MKKIIVAYIPVIHQGYLNLLADFSGEEVFLIDEAAAEKLNAYQKEIRTLLPTTVQKLLFGLKGFKPNIIGDPDWFSRWLPRETEIFSANDSVTREFNACFLPGRMIEYLNIFLRWEREKIAALDPVIYDCEISISEFDRRIMRRAEHEAQKSADWWRQVGAVLIKDGRVIMSVFNTAVPGELTNYILGDPRDFIAAGQQPELQTTLHCEQAIVAEAARRGLPLEGASIYVTVFPCPVCAKLIAYSGIKNCYFKTGHAVLDGQTILKAKGVKIVLVK